MDSRKRERLAKLWIAYMRAESDATKPTGGLEVFESMQGLTEEDPETIWGVILGMLRQDHSDKILMVLSAGPLENLLAAHGQKFIDRVEAEVQANQHFRTLLGGVWKSSIANEVWERIQKVAERW